MSKKSSKRYQAASKIARSTDGLISLSEGVSSLKKMPVVKFDETVELSVFLGVDPKQSNQAVRGTVSLPHGSGRDVRVVVFTENADEALKAGAEHAGLAELIEKVEGGWSDFDVAVATPSAMKEVRKLARVLGPRGLMPNPKSGTVSEDITAAVKAVKAGRVEFKMDKGASVAIVIGKRSFEEALLVENAQAAMKALWEARPSVTKDTFLKRLSLSSSMSPAVKLDPKEFVFES